MSLTTTYADYSALLKETNEPDLSDVTFRDTPLLASLPKDEKMLVGVDRKVPIRYGVPPGIATVLSTAQSIAAAKGSTHKAFAITHKNLLGSAQIPADVMAGAKTNEAAFLEATKYEFDGLLQGHAQVLNRLLYRDGWGDFGTVNQTVFNVKYITLTNAYDVYNFYPGQQLKVSPDESTSATRSGTVTVSGVDVKNSRVLLTGNASDGISAIANGDHVFLNSLRDDNGTPSKKVIDGLASFIPQTDPSASESFFGVDRSTGGVFLRGQYQDASNKSLLEALMDADVTVTTNGGSVDRFFCHPLAWNGIAKSIQGKLLYTLGSEVLSPKISFRSIEFVGSAGQTVKIVPDRACPVTTIWGLTLKSWKLISMGPAIRPEDQDGSYFLRLASDDGYEFRSSSRCQLSCNAPSHNIQIGIGTLTV